MNTPSFAISTAPIPLFLALRGISAIIGGFEMGYDIKKYRKLPHIREEPYPTLDLGEYQAINLSSQEVSTIALTHSLLTYSYDPESIASHLWELLQRDEHANRIIHALMTVTEIPISSTRSRVILTPLQRYTWERIAQALVHSTHFKKTIQSFSKSYLENLILPFMTPQVPPPISPATSGMIQSALKDVLLSRDGHKTVVGGIWNYDRPGDIVTNDIERQEEVQEDYFVPAHIIPYFFASTSRSSLGSQEEAWTNDSTASEKLRYYMQKFCGEQVAESVLTEDLEAVNHPMNGILLTPELYTSFRRLRWCIEAEPIWDTVSASDSTGNDSSSEEESGSVYRLRLLTKIPISGMNIQLDEDVLRFRGSDMFDRVPAPNPLYCNVHASIAKVLRASGGGGAVEAVLRNEQMLKEEASTGANWGYLGRDYLVRRLSAISEEDFERDVLSRTDLWSLVE
ncbi:hypothetical protein TWF694_000863 [Orbilia ellipsospora]|uniref:HNH nuclease domain-containing protein n=1 Tax=Orbilia ellipsospora TaxID=2528407 RepID=A0AAV9XQB8_9PEZI